MTETNSAEFDQFATDYQEVLNNTISFTGSDGEYFTDFRIGLLKKLFNSSKAVKILDVGCGDGTTAVSFKKYFPEADIKGIDVSEKSIEVAKTRMLENTEFVKYDGIGFPFPDESIDLVHFANVLHHVKFEHHPTLMKEVYRVLRKNGRIIVFEHNPFNPFTRYIVLTCPFDKDARLLYPRYLKKLIKSNNFSLITKRFILFFPRFKLFSPLLRLEKYFMKIPMGAQYFISGIKK